MDSLKSVVGIIFEYTFFRIRRDHVWAFRVGRATALVPFANVHEMLLRLRPVKLTGASSCQSLLGDEYETPSCV